MDQVLSDDTRRFVRAAVPENKLVAEMDAHAEAIGFPTVGREVGQFLRVLAGVAGAERIFEFGSGFGYSAYWFAGALPADGEIVLTEFDGENLETAREYLGRADLAAKATFEQGDAMETIERYDGPFDVVLIDHQKEKYPDALDAVRDKVREGGVVVADNAMKAGPLDTGALLASLEGEDPEMDEATAGVATYLRTVRDDPAFETSVLPLGEGIAVSYKRPSA